MLFHIFNVEHKNDTEILLYGKVHEEEDNFMQCINKNEDDLMQCINKNEDDLMQCINKKQRINKNDSNQCINKNDSNQCINKNGSNQCINKNGSMQCIKVTNIVSPVLFRPSPGKEEVLLEEIKQLDPLSVETDVRMTNIFYDSQPREISFIKAHFKEKPNLTNFESENCEMMVTEFQNPIEQFLITRRIMGPGIVEIPDTTGLENGKLESLKLKDVKLEDVVFLKNCKFPEIQTASIAVETGGGKIKKIVYYNKTKKRIETLLSDNSNSTDSINGSNRPINNSTNGSISDTTMINRLNQLIKNDNPDFIIFHNLHFKSRLNIRGKIFCDVFSFASGTVKGRDYSIQELCSLYRINKGKGLVGDAVALVDIVEAMNALNLAKEMAEISGYLLNRCLANSRAERIEYTILHELYNRKFLFPPNTQKKSIKYSGGLVLEPVQGFYEDIVLLLDFNSLYPSIIQEYDVCFSRYYNSDINKAGCDEGVLNNNINGMSDHLNNNINGASDHLNKGTTGETTNNKGTVDKNELILPGILRNLVERRKHVKTLIKNCRNNEERIILDVRQKALKLTANSIYGCLGFAGSRFCNFDMASFITAKGRELLNETRLVAESMNMRVIYGDTDSIMIHTKYPGRLEYYDRAVESVNLLVNRINGKYSNIEIEMEKVFKKLILYTKKKYAALVFDKKGSSIEMKGIDLVRRDFCIASVDLNRMVLNKILEDRESNFNSNFRGKLDSNLGTGNETKLNSNGNLNENKTLLNEENLLETNNTSTNNTLINNTRETAEEIYAICINFYASLFKRPIDDFVISTVLNKDISNYPSKTNLPHVNLALRLQSTVRYLQDDVINYVIGEGSGPISDRVFHPEETFSVDFQYYIKNQILPPLFRLISPLSYINTEKINMIFNVKNITVRESSSGCLNFILPCCGNVQEPSLKCIKCRKSVDEFFYVKKINEMIHSCLGECLGECLECGRIFKNHLTSCFYCLKELKFENKNEEFNKLLMKIEKGCSEMGEIRRILEGYLGVSKYRKIDMRRYFISE